MIEGSGSRRHNNIGTRYGSDRKGSTENHNSVTYHIFEPDIAKKNVSVF
jgi:hypothetical protein